MTLGTIESMRPSPQDDCLCGNSLPFSECCGPTSSRKHPREIVIINNAIPTKRCDDMVKYLSKQPREWLGVTVKANAPSGIKQSADPRRVTEAVKQGKLKTKITKLVRQGFVDMLAEHTAHTLQWFESPDLLYYRAGGRYVGHADSENYNKRTNTWDKLQDRDYSILFYLSDDFEGGDIYFSLFDFNYSPKKGDMVFFPSDHRYLHSARPVTSGHRYAIVSWCAVHGVTKVKIQPPPGAFHEDS